MKRAVAVVAAAVAVVAGGLVPGPAAGSAHRAEHHRSVAARLGLARPAGVRPADGGDPSAGDGSLPSLASLLPAGDLLGNGHHDVLDVRQSAPYGTARSEGITAREGSTGRALWHRRFDLTTYAQMQILPMRLGSKLRPGVLAVTTSDSSTDGESQDTVTLSFVAMSGRTGETLWTRKYVGVFSPLALPPPPAAASPQVLDSDYSYVPYFAGVVSRGAHRSAALIVLGVSGVDSSFTTTSQLVSTANGATQAFVDPLTDEPGFPVFVAASDLDGDGVSDVVVYVQTTGQVTAYSGATGKRLWVAAGLPGRYLYGVVPIGRLSSAHVEDLAVLVAPQIGSNDGDEDVYVVRGRGGKVLWHRNAQGYYLVHRAGKDLKPALGLLTSTLTSTATTSRLTEAWTAVDAADATVYTHKLAVSIAASPASYGHGYYPLGDVQADGADELGLDVFVYAGVDRQERVGLLDGRTGAFHAVPAAAATAGSLRRGPGDDLLAPGIENGHAEVTAWRGSDRVRYYQRQITSLGTWAKESIRGLRVSGNPCSDIAVELESSGQGGLGILNGNGSPRWLVTFANDSVVGGTVEHFAAQRHVCA